MGNDGDGGTDLTRDIIDHKSNQDEGEIICKAACLSKKEEEQVKFCSDSKTVSDPGFWVRISVAFWRRRERSQFYGA